MQSWIGSVIVLLSTVFFVLALGEGGIAPHQRIIDSFLHNPIAMGAVSAALFSVWKGWLGPVPRILQPFATLLLLTFVLFSGLGLVAWQPLWDVLKPFRVSQRMAQPLAAFSIIAVWFFSCAWVLLRGLLRRMRRRYEHHGFAVGFGPLYFYFRRRKAS